ncbi:MAG: N-acetylmuramoyl-L-alanine amidase, partial [Ruthenibacterium lactatiformans]
MRARPYHYTTGHGGTDIGGRHINEIQLTEATIGYLRVGSPRTRIIRPCAPTLVMIFQKHRARGCGKQRRRFTVALCTAPDPYSSDSYGLECYPQPPGRTHHEDSLRFAHLIADKFGAAGQRLRGNAGVRYIYYAGDDESGYEKQVVEESDSTVYSEQTFGLLEKTDCPAVLVEQCFVTSEADVAAWGTDDGCRRAARLYY